MGIDVYLNWDGKTDVESKNQITGFSTTAGRVGYLREAYHGGPYVTRHLLAEGFVDYDHDEQPDGVPIPAATLRERLPAAVALAIYREHVVYQQGKDPSHWGDLGAGTNEVVEKLLTNLGGIFGPGGQIEQAKTGAEGEDLSARLTPEQKRQLAEKIERRTLPDCALAFVDFVRLAEAKEAELGKPCLIRVSY